MAINYMRIGERIREYRLQKNMSQEDLAAIVLVNNRHISNVENGKKYPSLELIIEIANALGVSTDDLLCDSLTSVSSERWNNIHQILRKCSIREAEVLEKLMEFMHEILEQFYDLR